MTCTVCKNRHYDTQTVSVSSSEWTPCFNFNTTPELLSVNQYLCYFIWVIFCMNCIVTCRHKHIHTDTQHTISASVSPDASLSLSLSLSVRWGHCVWSLLFSWMCDVVSHHNRGIRVTVISSQKVLITLHSPDSRRDWRFTLTRFHYTQLFYCHSWLFYGRVNKRKKFFNIWRVSHVELIQLEIKSPKRTFMLRFCSTCKHTSNKYSVGNASVDRVKRKKKVDVYHIYTTEAGLI